MARKKKKQRSRQIVIWALIGAVAVLCLSLALVWFRDNRMPNFSEKASFYIRPGETLEQVIEDIDTTCRVLSIKSLERSFKSKKVGEHLTPGHYTLNEKQSSVYAARMINNGWQTPVLLTLSGSLRNKGRIALKISNQMLLDSATVMNALNDRDLLASYGYNPDNVFSLLMPDSYEIYWTEGVVNILDRQKKAQEEFWTAERQKKAKALNLTPAQVSILASIVDSETNYEPEMPKVAGVYLNRLKLGMRLQADPTVAYCFDYKLNRILLKHLAVDSPYNTYKHSGLPPGPICVPCKPALDAVLNPDFGGEWGKGNLYFCANPDFSRTHVFAKTLAQHNVNANAFHKELTRRQKMKK